MDRLASSYVWLGAIHYFALAYFVAASELVLWTSVFDLQIQSQTH